MTAARLHKIMASSTGGIQGALDQIPHQPGLLLVQLPGTICQAPVYLRRQFYRQRIHGSKIIPECHSSNTILRWYQMAAVELLQERQTVWSPGLRAGIRTFLVLNLIRCKFNPPPQQALSILNVLFTNRLRSFRSVGTAND
jgi:hypothetical protein